MSNNASEPTDRPFGHRTRTAPSVPDASRTSVFSSSGRVRLVSLSAAAVTMTIAGLGATLAPNAATPSMELTAAQIALDHTAAGDITIEPTVRLEYAATAAGSRSSRSNANGKPALEPSKAPIKTGSGDEADSDKTDSDSTESAETPTSGDTPASPPAMADADIPPTLESPDAPEPDSTATDTPRRDPGNADELAAGLEQLRTDTLDQAVAHAQAKAEAKAKAEAAAKAKAKAKAEAKAKALRDAWAHPLAPASFRMSAGYGAGGSLWSSGSHTGTDLAGSQGTAVKAVAAGTITDTGWAGAYGNRIELTTKDGHIIWFAHLSGIDVSRGATVLPGDTIGRLGSTGNSTGPHLHIETFRSGSRTDPVAFFTSVGVNLLTGGHITS